ncbi:MAG TPA: YdbL family protein [Allosphingosinicella sp.]|nr:YdbL family protein [Allosphingosinicella sp.]
MTRRMKLLIAAGIGIAMVAGTKAYAIQADAAGQLRATGQVGEQSDGYMGAVGSLPAAVRAQMEQVNIQRRAAYTQLAAQRRATIEEVAAATACQIFASRIGPGQHYRLPDGVWRQRNGNEPVPRPSHCG